MCSTVRSISRGLPALAGAGLPPVYAASLGRKTRVRGVRGVRRCTPLFMLLAQACHTRTRETGLVWKIRRLRGRAANKRPTADFEPGAFCFARRKAERRTWARDPKPRALKLISGIVLDHT
jgi:hypothetical protein